MSAVYPYSGERIRTRPNGSTFEVLLQAATVYTFWSADDRPLYVGCTTQGYVRFDGHGHKDWWTEVSRVDVEHFEDKSDGLIRERHLIRDLLPEHNFAHVPVSVLERRQIA